MTLILANQSGGGAGAENQELLDASLSTGILTGGTLSINGGDNTKFDVAAGVGVVVDAHTDPENPVVTRVAFGPFTAVSPTNIATEELTIINIDVNGDIVQRNDLSTSEQRRDDFTIGVVQHPDNATIVIASNFAEVFPINDALALSDFSQALTPIRTEGIISANGANLKLDNSDYTVMFYGVNYNLSAKDPNFQTAPADTAITFAEGWQDGSGGTTFGFTTDIKPGVYDDGTGGATEPNGTVEGYQWTVMRLFYLTDNQFAAVQFGQTVYNNKELAINGIANENPTRLSLLSGTNYWGALVVKGDATDLSDPDQAVFVEGDKFGQENVSTSGSTDGVANLYNLANGQIVDEFNFTVASNGTVITGSVEREGGGDLVVQFAGTNYSYDTSPADTIALTEGTDTVPVENFVYLTESAGTVSINKSTVGFPDPDVTPHARIATVICQSASSLQTDTAFKVHKWSDHTGNGVGHLADINSWIRQQNATWKSGVAPTTSITVNGGAIDNVYFSSTSGEVLQLHDHAFPQKDMETPEPAWVVNDSTTLYDRITDLGSIDTDSTGSTLRSNNTYYSLVIWGCVSEAEADCKYFVNVPGGTYSSSADVTADADSYSNYNIPADFKGTGFLIARVSLRYQTSGSGTITEIQTQDLRGLVPSVAAGGGGGGGGTTLPGGATGAIQYNSGGNFAGDESILGIFNDGLISRRQVLAKTGAYTVLAADSGSLFTNEGAAGEVEFTLPTAVAGLFYRLYVQAAQSVKITANTGDTIRVGADVTSTGGSISNSTVGGYITLDAINATEWVAEAQGSWPVVSGGSKLVLEVGAGNLLLESGDSLLLET